MLDEGFAKIIEGTDVCTVQTHIPSQCSTGQTVLEIMNEQLIIIRLSRHFPGIHNQVTERAGVPIILLKVRNFEFDWNLHTGD